MLQEYLEKGPDFIRSVNDVFSAAIYDGRTGRLLLFRDRLGVKPLFYTVDGIANHRYWQLESHAHEDDYETTVSHVRELLTDAVRRQMDGADTPCAPFSPAA